MCACDICAERPTDKQTSRHTLQSMRVRAHLSVCLVLAVFRRDHLPHREGPDKKGMVNSLKRIYLLYIAIYRPLLNHPKRQNGLRTSSIPSSSAGPFAWVIAGVSPATAEGRGLAVVGLESRGCTGGVTEGSDTATTDSGRRPREAWAEHTHAHTHTHTQTHTCRCPTAPTPHTLNWMGDSEHGTSQSLSARGC